MGEAVLVNRKKFVSSLANELVEPFNELSKKTRLTKTKLLTSWQRRRGFLNPACLTRPSKTF